MFLFLAAWLTKSFFFHSSQVAIKSIRKEKIKDEQDMVHIRREIEIMSSLRHPHIISIYEGERRIARDKLPRALQHASIQRHNSPPRIGLSCYDIQMSFKKKKKRKTPGM